MTEIAIESKAPDTSAVEDSRPGWLSKERWVGPGLLLPAILLAVLFSIIPLTYIAIISFTRESTFFFTPDYTTANYVRIWDRYMPHVRETLRLATLASLFDLVCGFPFAYILIRKVRYRELVRTLMVFPLFGPLYLSFGLYFLLLPNSPLAPGFDYLGIDTTSLLFSEPMTVFGMGLFTFPFMVMNIGTALANVDPMLEEAARTLGARPWQVFTRILAPLTWPGILAGFLMCFGWNLGVFVVPILLGGLPQQRVLSLTLQKAFTTQFDNGLASAMGIVLLAMAFSITWLSLRFSRGALGA